MIIEIQKIYSIDRFDLSWVFSNRYYNVNLIYDPEKKTRKILSTIPSLQVFLVSIY